MMPDPTHELHRRRFGRNLGVGLSLAAFVAIVFALTLVKIAREGLLTPGAARGQTSQVLAQTGAQAGAQTAAQVQEGTP